VGGATIAHMWPHLANLLKASWRIALAKGSSTGISVFWLGLGAIILGFAVTVLIEWIRGGRTMNSLKAAIKSWPPYVGAATALILVWASLYASTIVTTIYEDHNALIQQRNDAARQHNEWKQKFESSQTASLVAPKSKAQQPEFRWENAQPFMSGTGPSTAALIIANTTLSDLSFKLKCNITCIYTQTGSIEFDNYSGIIAHQVPDSDPTIAWVKISKPGILEKGKSVLVAVMSREGKQPTILSVNGIKPSF
jgi:hypothetical protein